MLLIPSLVKICKFRVERILQTHRVVPLMSQKIITRTPDRELVSLNVRLRYQERYVNLAAMNLIDLAGCMESEINLG